MRWLLALALLLSSSFAARADVTLYNFAPDATVPDFTTRITEHDVAGNAMDAHSGNILHDGGFFYLFGEHHGGGFRWRTVGSAADGFNVYRSTDLVNWQRRGYILDPGSAFALANCAVANVGQGCFRPHVLKNVANNNYVLWLITLGPSALYVTTCTAPDDASTCGTPTLVTTAHAAVDYTVFVDPSNGNGYIVYSVVNAGDRDTYIEALDSTYTIPQGSAVLAKGAPSGEAPFAFVRNGKTDIGFGSLCAYCVGGSTTSYVQASTPLGVYGAATQIDTTNACHTQSSANVNVFTSGGITTYLYVGDGWTSQQNQGWADQFKYPLTFTGDAIDTITCPTSVTIPGVTSAGTYPTPSNYPTAVIDQSDYAAQGKFNDLCFVNASTWSLQTFVPTQATLYGVGMALGKNQSASPDPEPATDGNVVVSLVNLDVSNNPTTTIGSPVTIAASALQWATQWTTLVFNATLAPGTAYGLVTKGSGTTAGCFTEAYSRFSNSPYTAGVHKFSTDSGSTWTSFPAYALMFATYSAAAPVVLAPISGLVH